MLKCKEITRLTSDYIDQNLGWRDSFSIKMHLLMCKSCQRFMENLKATIQVARNLNQPPLSSEDAKPIIDNSIHPHK